MNGPLGPPAVQHHHRGGRSTTLPCTHTKAAGRLIRPHGEPADGPSGRSAACNSSTDGGTGVRDGAANLGRPTWTEAFNVICEVATQIPRIGRLQPDLLAAVGCRPTRSRTQRRCLPPASPHPDPEATQHRRSLRRPDRCPRRTRSRRAEERSRRCPRRPARSAGPCESEPTRHLAPRTHHRIFVWIAADWTWAAES